MSKLFFVFIFFCCILIVNGNNQPFCLKFCQIFASNEDLFNDDNNDNNYGWCNNIILRPSSDEKTFSNAAIAAAKTLFRNSTLFVYLQPDFINLQPNSDNILPFIDGILVNPNLNKNLTFLYKIRETYPHLKQIVGLTYKSANEIFGFLNTSNQLIKADYFIINEKADLLLFPPSIRAKFVFKFDEVALAHEREMGFFNFINKIQHIVIDHFLANNDNGFLIRLTFQDKTDVIDKGFVCPQLNIQKPPAIYCYYHLPQERDTNFLSPDKIPSTCDRLIIQGAMFLDGAVEFQDNTSKSHMQLFGRLRRFSKALLIGSVKCENYNLYQPKGNQSTLLNSLSEYVTEYKLDGIEIDCEYFHEIVSYQGFLIELKRQLDTTKILGLRLPPFVESKFTSIPKNPKCVCKVDYAIIESLDYYVIRNDNPYFYKNIELPLFQRNFYHFDYLNPSKKLEVVSATATFSRIFKYEVEIATQLFAEAEFKKSYFGTQYDYTISSKPSGTNTSHPLGTIKEIIYEKTMTYKDMCLQTVANLPSYDYKLGSSCVNINDKERYFYDSAEVVKYLSGRKSSGIAFDSLNDDDWENACGKGEFPVFNSI